MSDPQHSLDLALDAEISPRRVRLRTLVLLRWLAVAGQTTTIGVVGVALGFETPLAACLATIAASAWVNLIVSVLQPGQKILSDGEAGAHLAFDVLQLSLLLALTGGLANPFVVLLGAPVVIAFTALRGQLALAIALLAIVSVFIMSEASLPLPWRPDAPYQPPALYQFGLAVALVTGAGFMSIFAWRLAAEARRMSDALIASQTVLAREQRLSALGGLAAAAAHELGTPLGTIHVVAKELARSLKPGDPIREDAELLVSQSERCRDILKQLSARGAEGDPLHAELSLRQLLEEVVEPLRSIGPRIEIEFEPRTGEAWPAARSPKLRRAPEVLYAISNYVENAVDYADAAVWVSGRWSADEIEIEVRDDGPGFAPDILLKLGEPYVTKRRPDQAHGGLGLGFFIAKTFVERTGGVVEFGNRRPPETGAIVRARWPRSRLAPLSPTN